MRKECSMEKKTISTPLLAAVLIVALAAIIYFAVEYANRSSRPEGRQAAPSGSELPPGAVDGDIAAPPVEPLDLLPVGGEGGAAAPKIGEPAPAGALPPAGGIGEIAEAPPVEVVVVYDGSAYSPATVEVKRGERVTFVNRGQGEMWPASAMHPTHTAYPGSDIKKCGSGEMIFDACKGLAAGESWTFTFDRVGKWNFHNHLNPSARGAVMVK